MKNKLNRALLVSLVLGAAGLLLNLAVVLAGHDKNGLVKPGYLPGIALVIVGIAGIAVPVALFWGNKTQKKYLQLFTASGPAAAALAVLALGLALTGIIEFTQSPQVGLDFWRCFTAILSGPALLLCAWCRLKGKRPVWLCWAMVTAHLILLLVSGYREWSRQTELNAYAYQLLACVSLMLSAYHQAAADAGVGNLKEYLIFSLMSVALCPIAMIGSPYWLFYLCFWLYHSFNLYCLNLKGD